MISSHRNKGVIVDINGEGEVSVPWVGAGLGLRLGVRYGVWVR